MLLTENNLLSPTSIIKFIACNKTLFFSQTNKFTKPIQTSYQSALGQVVHAVLAFAILQGKDLNQFDPIWDSEINKILSKFKTESAITLPLPPLQWPRYNSLKASTRVAFTKLIQNGKVYL